MAMSAGAYNALVHLCRHAGFAAELEKLINKADALPADVSATSMGFYAKAPVAQAAAAAALTISAGTADDTVVDVGATFSQTTLNNNFADVATKANKCLAVLRDLGLMAT